MKIKNRKGFTIIELVIVIAIIGILTAVLVPTFISLMNRANQASDQSLVKNLNTAMQAEEGEGKKNDTYHDAIEYLDNYGFKLANLATKSGYDLLWNSKSNRFLLNNPEQLTDDKINTGAIDAQYWTIKDNIPNDNKFSIYAGLNFDDTTPVNVTGIGFDAGSHNFANIYYNGNTSTNNVVIRTNGGTLSVNAASDSVHHYGDVGSLNIEAVATSSYHEYGTVTNAQIKKGRIVIERSDASIDNLLLIAKENKLGFEDIVVETKTGAELPTFDRTDVIISEKGTLVLNVVTPTSDEYIYLTKAGVIEQIVVTNEVKEDVSSETANVASKSETTQTVAEQVANVGKKNAAGEYVDSNNSVIALEDLTSENIVIAEAKADNTKINLGKTYFSGGAGTEKSPFLIASEKDWETLAAWSTKTQNYFGLTGYSYKVVNDLDMSYINSQADQFKFRLQYFHGTIDFDKHQMTWMTPYEAAYCCLITYSYNGCTIKNAKFNLSDQGTIIANYNKNDQNIVLQNVNIYGNILAENTNNYAPFCSCSNFPSEGSKLTMINCNNYCNITSSADNTGIFVGRTYGTSASGNYYYNIELINCNNYGTLINVNGNAGMLFSNAGTNFNASKVKVENCINYGTILGSKNANLICGNLAEKYYDSNNAEYDSDNNVKKLDVSNKKNGVLGKTNSYTLEVVNGNFVLPPTDNAEYYVLSFVTTYNNGGGATTSIVYHFNEEQRAALDFKAYEFSVGNGSNSTTGATATTIGDSSLDGKLYVKDGKYLFINSITTNKNYPLFINRQPTVSFMAFDENDNLLAAYNYTYSN